ncbi:MAG TPA: Sir2 family NAD-dependent protein deacetylase [Anaeromyxobacteraceae bacterium]|nr:Sir2 family NAD-dependent protein deacetylase [Anaeromyxobacteraceae bacterium]
MALDGKLRKILGDLRDGEGRVVVLTGAGISAESGIPTFRGKDGYWVVGSRNYMPQEMATHAMFMIQPEEVWRWYLYRFGVVRHARPNAGHLALVELERAFAGRFTLVTQNIDGLHRRAGSSEERTYCIHGDAAWIRCNYDCGLGRQRLPDLGVRDATTPFTPADKEALTCPGCGNWMRPHVLWFDEYYDEENYRFESTLRAAAEADLLLVVGTSGATNLPMRVGQVCFSSGAAVVDVNPEENPFSELAERSPRGYAARGSAAELLPEIVFALTGRRATGG